MPIVRPPTQSQSRGGRPSEEIDLGDDAGVRRFRELFHQAPGFMAILTGPDYVFEMANKAYLDLIGERHVLGLPLREALPEIGPQGFEALLDEVRTTGKPHLARAARVMLRRRPKASLEAAYIDFVYQPIRLEDGSVTGIFVQGHEVTAQKLATDELEAKRHETEAALSANQRIFDNSLDVICTVDAEGRFTQVSRHAESLWGFPSGELLGRRYIDLVHPDDVEATKAMAAQVVAGVPTKAFTNRCGHRDRTVVPVMWSCIWDEELQTFFAVARDMREHAAAEDKLRQAQKMEAVGQLTGGIAHDFNNLLTVIIDGAEMLAERLANRPDLEPVARLVLSAAERGADLVSGLLAFARQQPLVPQAVNCAALFKSVTPLLQAAIGCNVHIDLAASDGLCCLADPTQLTSALLNLCINARDAMPEGGCLIIRGRLDQSDAGKEESGAPAGASMAVLTVQDTGEGMTEAVLGRALEPFFTTKPVGKGSGLGLSMVYGFAAQSGGRLELASETGVGTTISVYLPAVAEADVEPKRVASEKIAPPVPRHILLVEDDDLLRRQVKLQLVRLGYRVTACEDGRGALEQIGELADIDLLLTDIMMPGGINGRQLAARAKELIPGLRTLFTSGFSDHASLNSDLVERADFLPKPYRRADLARKLEVAFARD